MMSQIRSSLLLLSFSMGLVASTGCGLVGEGSRNPQLVALDEQSLRAQPAPCAMPDFDQMGRISAATPLDYQLAFGCWAKHFEKTLSRIQGSVPGEFNVPELKVLARRQLLPLPTSMNQEVFWAQLPAILRTVGTDGREVLNVRAFQNWMESLRDQAASLHGMVRFLYGLPSQNSTSEVQWRVYQGAGKVLTQTASALLPRASQYPTSSLATLLGSLWPENARPERLARLIQLAELLTPVKDRSTYPLALALSATGESIEALASVLAQIAVDRPQKDLTSEGIRTAFDRATGAWKGFLAQVDLSQTDAALMQWPSDARTPLPVAISHPASRSELIRSFFELAEDRSTEWAQIVARYAQVLKQLQYRRYPLAKEFPADFPTLGAWVWGTPIALGGEVHLADLWRQFLLLLWGESSLRIQQQNEGRLAGATLLMKISDQWWVPSDTNGTADASEWARTWAWQSQAPELFASRTGLIALLSLRCDRDHDGLFAGAELECLMPRLIDTVRTAWMPKLSQDGKTRALQVIDNVVQVMQVAPERAQWFTLGLLNVSASRGVALNLEEEVWTWLREELHFPTLSTDSAAWRKVVVALTKGLEVDLVPALTDPKLQEDFYQALIHRCVNGDSLCLEQVFQDVLGHRITRTNNVNSLQFAVSLANVAPAESQAALQGLLRSDFRVAEPVIRALSRRTPVTPASIEAAFNSLERRLRKDLP